MTALRHLRSDTANKRPDPVSLNSGQLAINYEASSPGLFFKDTNGNLVKAGPVHIGTSAPNATPAAGGSSGNAVGEFWLDTTGGAYDLKVWSGAAWVSTAGEYVNITGDTMTGDLKLDNANLIFEGATIDSFETTLTVVDPTADNTITLPDVTGTVVTTGDTGTVTSTMIANATIVDADISASAEIAVSKLADGTARQLLQTDAAGTGVEWTSNVDVPGTLDVTGAAIFDSTVSIAGDTTIADKIIHSGDTNTAIRFPAADTVSVETAGSERARIDNAGSLIYGTSTSPGADITSGTGFYYQISTGFLYVRSNGSPVAAFNRGSNDGTLVEFKQDQITEGTISVSGTTVSYNGAHLSRWSQLPSGAERTEILRGTVLSNIDEMCEWDEEDNEQLNRMKVSDVEGDKNVSGVFQDWDDDDDTYTNDFYCAMTGDFIIRIAQGVTVERGDLLMSAGDGTAKPQDDDIIRSKTIAKVTSTNVSCTYDDGSYCVPCVLMAC